MTDEPAPPPPAAPGSDGDRDFQVVVLGSGPGGYSAAFRAADLGLKTALIERYDRLGGVCLNVGCIPSKALLHAARVIAETEEMASHGITFGKPKIDVGKLIEWKTGVVDRLTGGLAGLAKQRKVEVIHGLATFTGPSSLQVDDRTVTFDNCIIAAGSEAAWIPGLPDDPRVISSTGALAPDEIPGRMLVIGGGIIGLEMACVYDALGAKVTVVEMLDHLMHGADPDLVRPLAKRIESRYTDVLLVLARRGGQGAEERTQGGDRRRRLADLRSGAGRGRARAQRPRDRRLRGGGQRRRARVHPGRCADEDQRRRDLRDRRHRR